MSPEAVLAAVSGVLSDYPLLRALVHGAALVGLMVCAVALLEWRARCDLGRYRSGNFRTDLVYALVYQGGIYHTLLYAPVIGALALVIPQTWHLSVLERLPLPVGFLIFWVLSDAIGYGIHRAQHRFTLLWRFHSVHHAQTLLTPVTSYRNHLLEQLYVNVLMYVPLMLLGAPKWFWLPAMLLQNLFEALQHSELNWRYGRLYPVFVSPVFHAIHHSPERARHDSNYGKILSVWDRLFGTISYGERPREYGVAGLEMPVGFWATCVAPFRYRAATAALATAATPTRRPDTAARLPAVPADPSARDSA